MILGNVVVVYVMDVLIMVTNSLFFPRKFQKGYSRTVQVSQGKTTIATTPNKFRIILIFKGIAVAHIYNLGFRLKKPLQIRVRT